MCGHQKNPTTSHRNSNEWKKSVLDSDQRRRYAELANQAQEKRETRRANRKNQKKTKKPNFLKALWRNFLAVNA
ncbi:hypothetical protein VIBNISOn1_30040 [Vibrio nigripulchritudo SOn1]|uniref:Uncharacterized protein n=1 Tax=Vibrio nigripulchritudo SOn1 TaxID=1238450 RepID=A0AAV2VRR9_9VIBR|nr:hypothetical protein [Vibrio nigripulchritudo]CCO47349.1 hypothetical protein VIBNISOn1_30040 [Vibrio nigripulchritudo SOn1]